MIIMTYESFKISTYSKKIYNTNHPTKHKSKKKLKYLYNIAL